MHNVKKVIVMKTKNLLPISNQEEKEIFAGWYTSSSDEWGTPGSVPTVDIYPPGNGGGGWDSPWGGDDPHIGGGSGGGTKDPTNHTLGKELTVCPQVSTTAECSILAIGAINKFLGGEELGIHKDDFAEHLGLANDVGQAFANIIMGDGLNNTTMDKLVDDFFINEHISSTSDISNQLDQGHPILATMIFGKDPNGDIQGHAVVITGYDSATNMVTVANSLAPGEKETFLFDNTKLTNLNAISGLKDNATTDKYKKDKGDWWTGCTIGK